MNTNLKALRQRLALFRAVALLFTGTTAENLRYGRKRPVRKELTGAEVVQAC